MEVWFLVEEESRASQKQIKLSQERETYCEHISKQTTSLGSKHVFFHTHAVTQKVSAISVLGGTRLREGCVRTIPPCHLGQMARRKA